MTPKWRTTGNTFTTTAIGIVVPKILCITRQNGPRNCTAKNSGKATFVDVTMSYTWSPLHTYIIQERTIQEAPSMHNRSLRETSVWT
eukprot:CAMPEP_0201118162 /NCGR_PEP_ID=MMETSP0850-20130426/2291_1 /ASSEMBLY_ACC=CAM_ASM_000622 /TAXON_ID=183588 /ORGANISM="Pseudo-nitzschia fraudulenta, Strain WWA7" /LENGTH=86 /DNA_ID=CAMNT_0047383155 /DNA_START=184 /DNA_END=444 /DNA_ORIENTATION=-